MTFAITIQALIGPHTQQASGNTQCGVDWTRNSVYIIGQEPTHTTNYLSSVNMLTGAEQVWANVTTFTGPSGQAGNTLPPVAVDANGNVYLGWFAGNGGGLIQIEPVGLTEITSGGSNSAVPSGFSGILQCGLNNIPVGSTQFMLATGIGGAFAFDRYSTVFNTVTFAGRADIFAPGTVRANAVNCSGKTGSSLGFIAAGPAGAADIQTIYLSKVTCATGGGWVIGDWPLQNSSIPITSIATIIPTDIDGTWTQIYPVGICTDQTDGNPMLWLQKATSTAGYLVKFNQNTGAIIWQTSLPAADNLYSHSLSFSSVTTQKLYILTDGPNTITTVNTSDGSTSSYTSNLAGLTIYGPQSSNDARGLILCNVQYIEGAGSPTKLNSTPANYTGWSMLYVAPVPAPPPGNRRFLSQQGPVRTGSTSGPTPSSPPLPPTPPPPPPPPVVVTNITTLSGDPLITLSGSNIITDT